MNIAVPRWLGGLLLGLWMTVAAPASAAPTFPALTGRVVDQAEVLSPAAQADLSVRLERLEQSTLRQLVIVTVPSLQGYEIEDFGYQLGRGWGIGDARKDTGVLFLIAPRERRVRIEVGYGLEPVLTDALSNRILQDAVLPKFREGDIPGGILAGADALIEQLSLPAGEALSRAAAAHSGEARTDPVSLFLVGLVGFWIVAGLVAAIRGRGTEVWFWPLFFMMGRAGWRRQRVFRGGGGSFGGGGASGRW